MIAGLTILQIVVILVFLAIAWVVIKFLFRLTTRIACGCIGLIMLGVVIYLVISQAL
jgi:predicted membrane channel-forming protein YqfA (hemolysin III family)